MYLRPPFRDGSSNIIRIRLIWISAYSYYFILAVRIKPIQVCDVAVFIPNCCSNFKLMMKELTLIRTSWALVIIKFFLFVVIVPSLFVFIIIPTVENVAVIRYRFLEPCQSTSRSCVSGVKTTVVGIIWKLHKRVLVAVISQRVGLGVVVFQVFVSVVVRVDVT